MKCKRCGRENPSNAKRCMYCNTPFYGDYSNINMPQNKKLANTNKKKSNNKKADNAILASIIALILVFTTLIGVYAFQNFAPRKKGFSGGGGGGGIVSSTSNQPAQPNNDIEVSLDGEDPDVEIYSFNTDTYDILVGESKKVKFTAEIFVNIELEENDVSVVSDIGIVLGYMNDNGENGDSVANDGIYTLVAELRSDTRKALIYQAKAKNVYSNSIELYFYTEISDEEYEECNIVIDKVDELNDINAIKNYLSNNANVIKCTPTQNGIKYTLKSGITCIWEQIIADENLKGNSSYRFEQFADYTGVQSQVNEKFLQRLHNDGDVCVIRPFRTAQFKYDDFLYAGNILGDILEGSVNKYDDENATLEIFKTFNQYGVILLDSHGTLSTDPYLLTGTKYGPIKKLKSADLQSGRIVLCSGFIRKSVAVGHKFFDRYYTDNSLNGSAFYLGTCYSMYNDTIADVLIKKGAEIVYGFSNVVSTTYCNNILKDAFIDQMILNVSDAQAAFVSAKQNFGNIDPYENSKYNCKLCMKGDESFKFVSEKECGELYGSVKDAATSNPVKNALVRIYQDGKLIKSLRTDNSGLYKVELPADNYVIKITFGQYKSAKISAEISEGITTYVETLLMIEAGLNSGFANGTITDAVSGQEVDNVSLKMRFSWNNKDGRVLHTTSTNENGYYEISFVPGFYTIEYSKDGYITGYKNIIIGIVDYEAQNAVISPEMPDDGNFRIVLSWSNKPKDLDSHLTGPTANGDRFHLYYKYANTSNRNDNSDYYQLDLDNTDIVSRPNIPETTTIVTQLDGVYRYSVHDYTNRGNGDSDAMSQSNATVNVYKGSVLVATYHVPPNVKGSIWTVFELSGNEIKPINKIGNGLEDDVSKF